VASLIVRNVNNFQILLINCKPLINWRTCFLY